MSESIEKRASFDYVRYANCWEDADILIRALDTGKGKNFLSIGSAGDNSLALLLLKPELVVAVDLNPAQLACVELRKLAFKNLKYEEMLQFLGFKNALPEWRLSTFISFKNNLSPSAQNYFQTKLEHVKQGIIHFGKFEKYFGYFKNIVMPLVHSRSTIDELLAEKSHEQQREFYNKKWNTWRWKLLFKIFFSKAVMGKAGRDPEFFTYVEGSVADRILARTKYALTEIPTHSNPYMRYILKADFEDALPLYARAESFKTIKENIDKLQIFKGMTDDALRAFPVKFDGYNLSDIFEYMDEKLFLKTARNLLENANPGARFAYWNMLVPRRISQHLPEKIEHLQELSDELFKADKAFFYSAFFVEQKR
ncbi:MAG TPA: DUF3419 family protein [Patescibacteria group bacterium]|nr:DUF3419 family protein [Patescibacteria group bacterium]